MSENNDKTNDEVGDLLIFILKFILLMTAIFALGYILVILCGDCDTSNLDLRGLI